MQASRRSCIFDRSAGHWSRVTPRLCKKALTGAQCERQQLCQRSCIGWCKMQCTAGLSAMKEPKAGEFAATTTGKPSTCQLEKDELIRLRLHYVKAVPFCFDSAVAIRLVPMPIPALLLRALLLLILFLTALVPTPAAPGPVLRPLFIWHPRRRQPLWGVCWPAPGPNMTQCCLFRF